MTTNRRSILIDGRVTSILLEPAFWRYLDKLAQDRGYSWSRYARLILHEVGEVSNRAAAIKQYLLEQARQWELPDSRGSDRLVSANWEWQSGGGEGVFVSKTSLVTIGRVPSCDIVLDDEECSRTHAALFNVTGSWWVADLDSKNGVWIGEERVRSHELATLQWVELGNTRLRLAADMDNEYGGGGK